MAWGMSHRDSLNERETVMYSLESMLQTGTAVAVALVILWAIYGVIDGVIQRRQNRR